MSLSSLFGKSKNPLSFEVQVHKAGRWITETVCKTEEEARAHGTRILPNHEGIRVVREFTRPDGGIVETVVLEQMRQAAGKKPIVVGTIEEAPVCKAPEDYLGFDSRQTITRLLRQYLEEKSLTASELLHNPGEMKRVMSFESLVPSAVGKVAGIQAKATGEDMKARRDGIFDALEVLKKKVDQATLKTANANPKQGGFAVAMEVCEKAAAGDKDETEYLGRVMLCRDLVNVRNLVGKVELILEMSGDGAVKPEYMAILDGLAADALGSTTVVQDLLGRQPSLGAALLRVIDILDGKFEPQEREQSPAVTGLVSKWIGGGRAPQSRKVLLDFLVRNVGGTQKLANEASAQTQAFRAIVARALADESAVGTPEMMEAVTQGYLRFIQQGGGEGRRLSIEGVCGMIDAGHARLRYLTLLSRTALAAKEMPTVSAFVGQILGTRAGVNALVPPELSLKPRMQIMAALYTAMLASGLPENERTAYADRLDMLVAEYITANKIIEKLDDPAAPLRTRAGRLVQFAATDVLASPKARRIVRDQIIGHLRQPNFDGKFVEGLATAEEKAAALKHFYELLARAQFM